MNDLRSTRIKISPSCYELSQVVRAQYWGVSGEIVKVVHDDSHEQVQHDEGAEEDEGDEVDVGHGRPAPLLRVRHVQLPVPVDIIDV